MSSWSETAHDAYDATNKYVHDAYDATNKYAHDTYDATKKYAHDAYDAAGNAFGDLAYLKEMFPTANALDNLAEAFNLKDIAHLPIHTLQSIMRDPRVQIVMMWLRSKMQIEHIQQMLHNIAENEYFKTAKRQFIAMVDPREKYALVQRLYRSRRFHLELDQIVSQLYLSVPFQNYFAEKKRITGADRWKALKNAHGFAARLKNRRRMEKVGTREDIIIAAATVARPVVQFLVLCIHLGWETMFS
jgi:hypothetical protein